MGNQKYVLFFALFLAGVSLLVGYLATPYMGWATLSYFLILRGFLLRKTNQQLHSKLMKYGMLMDLLLVLVLELTRSATKTAIAMELLPIQQVHILFSTLAVIGYFPLFILGQKHLKGAGSVQTRVWHKRIGILTFVFRSLGFFLMFSMLLSHRL